MTQKYRSIFSACTSKERQQNFDNYWIYSQEAAGQLYEAQKDLEKKRKRLKYFQDNPVRSNKPLADPEVFYCNYVRFKDDPATTDRKILLLTCIYKFARHEWVGISAAWDAVPSMAQSKTVRDKISRVHLAEEFCHIRFFDEMFRTFRLDKVKWAPPGPVMGKVYRIFPYFPGYLMDAPAFVTELMGMTFYQHLNALLDDVLADEPKVRDRLREILCDIMVDELAHVGQRRNFLGPVAIRFAHKIVELMYRMFFNEIPEVKYLFDVEKMIQEGKDFDLNSISSEIIERSWIPSYCYA